jgi:hypothetical protein
MQRQRPTQRRHHEQLLTRQTLIAETISAVAGTDIGVRAAG